MKNKTARHLTRLGCLFILAALAVWLFEWNDNKTKAALARQQLSALRTPSEKNPADERFFGDLLIPALELELPVLSTYSQEAMDEYPCLYANDGEHLVVCAHNADSHFGRIGQLGFGDEITIRTSSASYRYQIEKVEVLEPTEVKRMVESDYALTLFTCTPFGVRRVAVRAALCEENADENR